MSTIKNKSWPKEVPVLTADDMLKFEFEYGDQACLVGWARKIFSGYPRIKVFETMRGMLEINHIDEWNDDHTEKETAAFWNSVMQELGYTEVSKC